MAEASATEPAHVRVKDPGEGALRNASQRETEAIAEAEAVADLVRTEQFQKKMGGK
jgi:hypothetical protein